jgi:carbon monoxide dehydrogenase subunit G
MILDHRVTVPATPERTWAFLMDIPQMATCVPGVETVTETGPGVYTGILGVRVGPVRVRLEGRVRVTEQDPTAKTARLEVEATDRRIRGAVSAWSAMLLEPRDDGSTDLVVHTEASVLGKLGQFGQAVLRKKADQLVGEWASNLGRALAAAEGRG